LPPQEGTNRSTPLATPFSEVNIPLGTLVTNKKLRSLWPRPKFS
jgi:hypothetical protein